MYKFDSFKSKVADWIHKQILFLLTLSFITGLLFGLYFGTELYKWRLSEAVKVGGFTFNSAVYEVKERVVK